MHWCCLLAQNAPLQAVLLFNAAPSTSSLSSSSTGSTRARFLSWIYTSRADAVLLLRGVTGHKMMHAGAESALQASSCSHHIMLWSPFMI